MNSNKTETNWDEIPIENPNLLENDEAIENKLNEITDFIRKELLNSDTRSPISQRTFYINEAFLKTKYPDQGKDTFSKTKLLIDELKKKSKIHSDYFDYAEITLGALTSARKNNTEADYVAITLPHHIGEAKDKVLINQEIKSIRLKVNKKLNQTPSSQKRINKISDYKKQFSEIGQGGESQVRLVELHGEDYVLKTPSDQSTVDKQTRLHNMYRNAQNIAYLHGKAKEKNKVITGIPDKIYQGPGFTLEKKALGAQMDEVLEKGQYNHLQIINLFKRLANTLNQAHSLGIMHRDIKPENIIVNDKDGELIPTIIDWGLAGKQGEKRTTALGSRPYCSNDAMNLKATNPRYDLYSLGIMFHKYIVGKMPFILPSTKSELNNFTGKLNKQQLKFYNNTLRKQLSEYDSFYYISKALPLPKAFPSENNTNWQNKVNEIILKLTTAKNRYQKMSEFYQDLKNLSNKYKNELKEEDTPYYVRASQLTPLQLQKSPGGTTEIKRIIPPLITFLKENKTEFKKLKIDEELLIEAVAFIKNYKPPNIPTNQVLKTFLKKKLAKQQKKKGFFKRFFSS